MEEEEGAAKAEEVYKDHNKVVEDRGVQVVVDLQKVGVVVEGQVEGGGDVVEVGGSIQGVAVEEVEDHVSVVAEEVEDQKGLAEVVVVDGVRGMASLRKLVAST